MLWRVRTTLPDRPGALAVLARRCGESGVNILGLQIFPGVEDVTDELVLRTPLGWEADQVAELLEDSGGSGVVVLPSRESALVDQPTRYIRAAQMILERPLSFPEVVGRLFDTDTEVRGDVPAEGPDDVMEMTVGDVEVQLRRRTPFTATEHARSAALADLVTDVLRRDRDSSASWASEPVPGAAVAPDYVVDGPTVTALMEGVVVGRATVHDEDGAIEGALGEEAYRVTLSVEPAWRRRGIGTRLLIQVSRLARARGADALLLTTTADNQAVLPLVLAAGMRGLIRMAGGELTVRVPVHKLRPLML
ncbi:GNAT family N-acetyltransferase [Nocardioides sp. BP30]|uniref:GNAT family N-acetyltransferase n=1 Tax=Nocardioides sp. BP30 TaxID=3036374 RepID=UPI002468EB33|nr:GNAT family N-acetyltransferase [Nocardioides sp. BP30]WGL53287.1 GNAT family N-acetyltransferase [Nocardioides sp. BP30]